MFIIDDSTSMDVVISDDHSRGLIPRNFATHPVGTYDHIPAAAIDMPTLEMDEIIERVKYREEIGATVRAIRRTRGPKGGMIPSLDQDGVGYCWNHSGTMGVMLARAIMNQPYVPLSAFMVGCIMKDYRDRGGWGADGVDFISKHGVPDERYWPQRSMKRSLDTPEMRANAALHKITEGWIDMQTEVWDRSMTWKQQLSWLAAGGLIVADYNWWGHSVLLMDLVILDGKPWPRGINSWGDGYGDKGEFILQGDRAIMNGGVGIRTVMPSAA
jgi:hypothetical protein